MDPPRANTHRTFSACLRCRRRKARCDSAIPSCHNCQESNEPCQYVQRQSRGLGRSKQRIRLLEDRLHSVESVLQRSSTNIINDETLKDHPRITVSDICEPNVTDDNYDKLWNSIKDSGRSNPDTDPLRTQIQGFDESNTTAPPSATAAMLPDYGSFRARMVQREQLRLTQVAPDSPIPKTFVMPFIECAVREIGQWWPILGGKSVFELVDEQYASGPTDRDLNPARWALVHALLGTSLQWKAASSAVNHLFPTSWTYFKKAFSVFPQLCLQGKDITACHAILVMAMFMHGTGDSQATSSLITAVAHLVQVLGLQNRESYLQMGTVEAEKCNRLFWMVHIIGNTVAMCCAIPAFLGDDDTEIELPSDDSLDELSCSDAAERSLFRHMAQLSIIQSGILTLLRRRAKILRQSPAEFFKRLARLDHQLEDWKLGLPVGLSPMLDIAQSGSNLDSSIAHLHLLYYATAYKLYAAIAHCDNCDETHSEVTKSSYSRQEILTQSWSSPTPAHGARASIFLTQRVTSPALPQLWQQLQFALTAYLILVAAVLEFPAHTDTPLNVDSIRQFVLHLKSLNSQGYDVNDMFNGCSKIFELVLSATKPSRDKLPLNEVGGGSGGTTESNEQCRHVLAGLKGALDLMHVASGLMGNMPGPCAKAAQIFSGIFEALSSNPTNGFGPFVPVALYPSNYQSTLTP